MANLFKKKFMKTPHLGKGGAFSQIGKNAYVDWLVILAISLLVCLILITLGLNLYWKISSGNFTVSEDSYSSVPKSLDTKDLEKIINSYDIKEGISAEARRGYRGPADPAL